nr:reverse transcriptase domain-containing protein [Tanacetum cinerariifolium]
MFKKIHFNISFSKALAHMPKFEKMIKDLLTNKEKPLEIANTPVNENCSAVILKKLPEKLRDTGRFLITCEFHGLESCIALADLGASINLKPLSIWKKLSLPELSTTQVTLELATRTVAIPAGIAEDVFVQVGKFTFPADFVVVDYEVDPHVPLILGRPFLRMAHALVDVHGEKLTLLFDDVWTGMKLWTFSKLAIMDLPGDTMARTTPRKKFLTLVEAKALPTNNARVVVKFLKQLFSRFGTPRAIITDRGTHFCNDQFSKVLQKYGVMHRLSTSYHPQTSGQVEVSNRGLKRILERMVGEHRVLDIKNRTKIEVKIDKAEHEDGKRTKNQSQRRTRLSQTNPGPFNGPGQPTSY